MNFVTTNLEFYLLLRFLLVFYLLFFFFFFFLCKLFMVSKLLHQRIKCIIVYETGADRNPWGAKRLKNSDRISQNS